MRKEEDLLLKSYTSYDLSGRRPWQKNGAIILGIIIIITGLFMKDPLLVTMGVVLAYISLYKKTIIADEDGMTIHYNAIVYRKTKHFSYEEFSEIRAGTGGGMTHLGFIRRGMPYPIFLMEEDAEAVMEMALEKNPDMTVRHYNRRRKRFRL